ncbi:MULTISPECIES: chemotaxis protein CheW [Marinomonas]|uniref:Chemotaxis protein CheW n=1 Tax=Marinomonas rhodophyticola TaxID=2992803 RepID=A0ABT3KFU2_9GAMM|nr:chemotaxis protein CheW [Marinomonas sp. KJ51-3]MCW4629392.1 chemotaxis protein CheW [Marinomonas sp. KJ51-3]
MKETKSKEQALIGPQLAVQRYLDDLLQEATTEQADDQEVIEDQYTAEELDGSEETKEDFEEPEELEAFDESEEAQGAKASDYGLSEGELSSLDASFKDFEEAISSQVSGLSGAAEEAHLPQSEPELELETELEPEPEPVKKVSRTDPLPWATGRFECLLFYVGGLKMAVPLVELGGIFQSSKDKLTSIFGQPNWFMGVANVGEFNLRTVDTALWVMPNHYQGEMKENFKFVIQLDRSNWGVACERVAEAITLEPSQVKWRSDRSKRPWLAGTVIDHMCAILDVQGFIELLDDPNNGFRRAVK